MSDAYLEAVKQISFDASLTSAFGTLETGELTPVVQLDFIHGINSQTGASTLTSGGGAATSSGRLALSTSANSAGAAVFASRRIARYRAGQGMVARFTAAFTTGVADNTQIAGVGTANDGYFFGFNGATFGILHRNGGANVWTAQTSWNGDKADGTGPSGFNWNKTYGNVCQIKYPFLGYGDILFFVQDSVSGRFILVHTIRYTNSTASIQLSNPSLGFYAQTINSGNTSNMVMYVGSVGIFISGSRSFASNPKWATDNNKSGITAETNIFSVRNATTYNGVTNRGLLRLQSLSAAATAAANYVAIVRLRIGATLGGVPAYSTINGTTADNGVTITSGNSIASVDTAGTTATGGTLIYNLTINSAGEAVVDLTPFDLFVAPTEILTVSGFATGSTVISCALNWAEEI